MLAHLLGTHPDPSLVDYVTNGLFHGFSIGFTGLLSRSATRNLVSAYAHSQAVSDAIRREVSKGHTAGPFAVEPMSPFHCSPIGAVEKKDGSARIILDLSSPRGSSVNEGIDPEDFAVKYCSFDEALALVTKQGPSAFMAKAEIKHAFRLCPVLPSEWYLLGYHWNGQYYYDMRLPFGSRSSPFIFNTFANLLCWILHHIMFITCILHYLDDFFICQHSYASCLKDRDKLINTFSQLKVPLAPDKLVGPTTTLTFLGIEIDSVGNTISLPSDKFNDLMGKLSAWENKKKCTKRELLSLIGALSFTCKVVKCGRFFMRRLIDLSMTVTSLNHHISLNSEAQADIAWWLEFLPSWNGMELIQPPPITSFDIELSSDASALGIGAACGNHWISYPISTFACLTWTSQSDKFDINFWELFALVVAVFAWGDTWNDKQILIFVDNISLTFIWMRGSKCKYIMRLVRQLFLFTAARNINIMLHHIPGHSNILADHLSRLQVPQFKRLLPSADPLVTTLPNRVWQL